MEFRRGLFRSGAPDHAAQRHCRRTQLHRKYPGAGMTLRISTLPNGLRVVSETMPQVKTVSVGIWVDAGARDETPEINGVAHMLEHMAFKGTERRSALAIAEEIEAVGGHLNAFTSREQRSEEHTSELQSLMR